MKKLAFLLVLIGLYVWPASAPAQSPELIQAARQGGALYHTGRYDEALPFKGESARNGRARLRAPASDYRDAHQQLGDALSSLGPPCRGRTLSLPAFAVKAVREHRRLQLESRLALGAGTLPADMPVFGDIEGNWPNPYSITDRWRNAIKSRKIPKVTFHALRHSHASALIAAGLDVVTVSRRLGHASPALTLSVYSHMFNNNDEGAALAIDEALSK